MALTQQAKHFLGFAILVGIFVLFVAMFILADNYGEWVWAIPPVVIVALVVLSVRYTAVRSVTTGGLNAVGQWWGASKSNRSKERVSIPAEIRRAVFERAGGECEHPDCHRTTRNHYHHIDEDPSRYIRTNIVYICPNHHDDAHRGIITRADQQRWARRRPRRSATSTHA